MQNIEEIKEQKNTILKNES